MEPSRLISDIRWVITPKRAQKMDEAVFIKRGNRCEIQREIDAVRFVNLHTTIPTPFVIESNVDDDKNSWFTMKAIPGSSLTDSWPHMTVEAQEKTRQQLQKYVNDLRCISASTPGIGSCTGGPAFDHRLNNGFPCGPFACESDFNDFLIIPVTRCPRKELASILRGKLLDDHKIMFTHADLCGDHILVEQETGEITGIIDWEMAGWWPEYWEYNKALFGERHQQWWQALVSDTVPCYPNELSVDRTIQDYQSAKLCKRHVFRVTGRLLAVPISPSFPFLLPKPVFNHLVCEMVI